VRAAPEAAPAPPWPPPRSAYVHLPFCKKKCLYCDFPVIAVGSRPGDERVQESMTAYVDALCREVAATRRLNDAAAPLQTLFFGGGTPSLIPPALLERIISAVDRAFGLASDAEVSIEADPGTFTADQLRTYCTLGVTRVSVGVQAFDEELLRVCGRAHGLADAYRAIEAVHAAGMPSWSLDLMSGLPGLTEDGWQRSLAAAVDAAPPHISVYDLQAS
jgi:oxygen-independent coproporphyrinogen-3 oxidase